MWPGSLRPDTFLELHLEKQPHACVALDTTRTLGPIGDPDDEQQNNKLFPHSGQDATSGRVNPPRTSGRVNPPRTSGKVNNKTY